jgi:hypothetical protein
MISLCLRLREPEIEFTPSDTLSYWIGRVLNSRCFDYQEEGKNEETTEKRLAVPWADFGFDEPSGVG